MTFANLWMIRNKLKQQQQKQKTQVTPNTKNERIDALTIYYTVIDYGPL